MAATFPAAAVDGDDRFPHVEIDRHHLRIGDVTFDLDKPDPAYVAQNGIKITPERRINRVTVTFIVGRIDVADDVLQQIRVTQDAD